MRNRADPGTHFRREDCPRRLFAMGISPTTVRGKKVGLPVHPADYIQGFTKWGHAKMALDAWAELLREALDEAHGR